MFSEGEEVARSSGRCEIETRCDRDRARAWHRGWPDGNMSAFDASEAVKLIAEAMRIPHGGASVPLAVVSGTVGAAAACAHEFNLLAATAAPDDGRPRRSVTVSSRVGFVGDVHAMKRACICMQSGPCTVCIVTPFGAACIPCETGPTIEVCSVQSVSPAESREPRLWSTTYTHFDRSRPSWCKPRGESAQRRRVTFSRLATPLGLPPCRPWSFSAPAPRRYV